MSLRIEVMLERHVGNSSQIRSGRQYGSVGTRQVSNSDWNLKEFPFICKPLDFLAAIEKTTQVTKMPDWHNDFEVEIIIILHVWSFYVEIAKKEIWKLFE